MLRKIIPRILIFCLCLVCVGCSGKSTQGIQSTPAVNQILANFILATPVKGESSLSNQTLELRNCDGKAELHRSLATEKQVVCHVTIAGEATSTTTGDTLKLSAEMKDRLAEQVQNAYQQVYEEAKARVEQTDFVVPVGKIRTFTIYWEQQVHTSTISFPIDDEDYTVSYTYTLDVPRKSIASEISCTG